MNAFYALDRRKTPMIVSFLAVALNLFFNWLFTFRLGLGHRGLALSTGLVASCNFLLLYVLMGRQLGGFESRRMMTTLGKVALAGAALAAVCAASSHWLLADWATAPTWSKAAALFGTVAAGALVFAGCCVGLRIAELHEVVESVRRRLARAP